MTADVLDDATEAEMNDREAAVAIQLEATRLTLQQAAEREAARCGAAAICVRCRNPIPEPRRQAVPGCLRCALCERQHENQRNRANR